MSSFKYFRYNEQRADANSFVWSRTSYAVISELTYNTIYTIAITAHGCKNDIATDSVKMTTDDFKHGDMHFGHNANFTKEKIGNYFCLLEMEFRNIC